MKRLKKLKKNPTNEELLEHHIVLDQCPEDFEVDVFYPYYMPPRIVIKKTKSHDNTIS